MPLKIDDMDRLRIQFKSLNFPPSCEVGGWRLVTRVYRLSGYAHARALIQGWSR